MSPQHTLTEYGDFECPYCGNAYAEVKDLRARLGDALAFEFRHFPIEQRHPHALQAAEAAEAARAQGRFEPMHDLMFENQRHLERDDLARYAQAAGVEDVDRFQRELDDHTHLDKVRADQAAALEQGVNGTPSFFIDGQRYEGFYDAESMAELLG
jgi:protein-disulfide isomerase